MLVGEVDDGLGVTGTEPDAVEVVEVATQDPRALPLQRRGGGVRPGESRDLVSGAEQLVDRGRADPPGRARDEDVHVIAPSLSMLTRTKCEALRHALPRNLSKRCLHRTQFSAEG
ncbi:hypothetical protein GCM10027445_19590 [Amycolatopsis endophytica]